MISKYIMSRRKFDPEDLIDYDDWDEEGDEEESDNELNEREYTFVPSLASPKVTPTGLPHQKCQANEKNQAHQKNQAHHKSQSNDKNHAHQKSQSNEKNQAHHREKGLGQIMKDLNLEFPPSSWYLQNHASSSQISPPPAPTVFVVIGHVDAGKSTLNAQLVRRFGSSFVSPEIPKNRKKKNESSLAWELDVGADERQHGVTIDSKSRQLFIQDREFVAIDAPGHADFVPSMLLGAMQADAAVMVIDCTKFDSGFSRGGQTKEHLSLIRALGITQLVVVLNKIDQIDSQDHFERLAIIKSQLIDFLVEIKLAKHLIAFVPCSAVTGENLFGEAVSPDYLSLEQALTRLVNAGGTDCRMINHSVCIPVADVGASDNNHNKNIQTISGRIECGSIHEGEKLMVLPSKQLVYIRSGGEIKIRGPGAYLESVEIESATADGGHVEVHAGSVIVDAVFPIPGIQLVEKFLAKILVINDDFMPIVRGQTVTVNVHTAMIDASISRLVRREDGEGTKIKCLVKGDVAVVEITLRNQIVVEPNDQPPHQRVTGRVVLRDRGVTIAAGLVVNK